MATCPFCAESIPEGTTVCPHCRADLTVPHRADAGLPPSATRGRGTTGVVIAIVVGVGFVVVICGGILLALLLPAVQQAREAARMTASKNNLKQMTLAMHHYHDTHSVFPPGGVYEDAADGLHGWQTLLLPYMDHAHLYRSISFDQPWDAPVNADVFRRQIPSYLHPSISEQKDGRGYALSHYSANSHLFGPDSATPIRDITDGTSYTFLGGEIGDSYPAWGQPDNWRDPALGLRRGPTTFGGPSPGGTNFMFCDGSVRFISDSIDPNVLRALSTPDGAERVPAF